VADGVGLSRLAEALGGVQTLRVQGKVLSVVGLCIRASVPGARVGEIVRIGKRAGTLRAKVVGFDETDVLLLPIGDAAGLGPGDPVEPDGGVLTVRAGPDLVGRVLDGLGEPADGGAPLTGIPWGVERPPPPPLSRRRVDRTLALGVRVLDGMCTTGEGQRIGLFAGSGVGKSTLLGQIARQTEADVSVIALVGERGREVREFLEDALGPEGRDRSVVVCATSDAPALVRLESAHVATAIAEWFRDQGMRVLLMMDSVTRYARALREVGLAAGEPPARRGYPPSVFAALPRLLERSGNAQTGSITALYTVLVEGGDLDEPVADEVRGILDGHVVLTRRLAERGHFPAVDPLQSLSRVMDALVDSAHRAAAARLRTLLAAWERQRDLILLGAYRKGSDPDTDEAIRRMPAIEAFLRQDVREAVSLGATREALLALVQ
jgi:type III secretion protein N (ATPase)